MENKEFRAIAHEMVDWMADYLESVGDGPIVPKVKPGEIRGQIPENPPDQGEPFESIMGDFKSLIVPGMTHWNHPGWFAYFPANNSPPSILAEMLVATLGAQCMSWQTSPAATELEQVVMDWLARMLALPESFTGVIQDSASTSTLVALLSAREQTSKHRFGLEGGQSVDGKCLRVYGSSHSHSSIDKAVKLAGFGLNNLVRVPVDETFAIDARALRAAILEDIAAGHVPSCVVGTIGTTSSTAVDPLREIGLICQEFGLWFHIDGAYGGSAGIVPELRFLLDGVELADSFVFNPHKWLLTNFDCSAYYVRSVDTLLNTFQSSPEYLKTRHDKEVSNFRDWGIPLGRRFRALKLWFVIRSYGVSGLQKLVRNHVAMAQSFAGWIEGTKDFEVVAPVPLALVCFRYVGELSEGEQDAFNERLMGAVNEGERVYLTHTRLNGRYVLRMAIGQRSTDIQRVREAFDSIIAHSQRLLA